MKVKQLAMWMAAMGVMSLGMGMTTAHAAQAKNVILMISDGCSWGCWDMASYWEYGQKGMQPYDSFPVKLGMTTTPLNASYTPTYDPTPMVTYDPVQAWDTTVAAPPPSPGDHRTDNSGYFDGYNYIAATGTPTDSAASATAMATGVKTYNNALNYDNFGQPLPYITQMAKAQGKSTGILSSVEYSHATPAAFGAQNASRNNYGAISEEMVNNPAVDLIMGAGNPFYDSNGNPRATPNYSYTSQNAWNALNDPNGAWQLIQTKQEFEDLANGTLAVNKKIFGLPQVYDTLQQSRGGYADSDVAFGDAFNANVPSLETMTKGALNVLGQNPDGFFMMVEGGAVDWAAHALQASRIIEEQVDFNNSVSAVVDWVETNSSWDETLVIVLTDHGNSTPMGPDSETVAFDPIENNGAGNMPGMDWYGTSYDHKNEMTLFWAKGAGSDLFLNEIDGADAALISTLGHNADGKYINNADVFTVMNAAMVPEPETWAMLLAGLGLVSLATRRAAGR